MGMFTSKSVFFKDEGRSHWHFWEIYKRPPKEEYWDYIVDRRDLLVPQDIRERKGSFFTPQIWVQKSQEYLTKVFGENWQEEYYVWDCAAGTGNLLVGLANRYNLWASTLDRQDVDVMRDRINNGANLLADHVFQFDFLNDSFDKLPERLKDIINDPEKRRKLVIYINPPYAETMFKGEKHKAGLNLSMVNTQYSLQMGNCANRELYIQFLTRIYSEIPDCFIGTFSTLKTLNAPHFNIFRSNFKAKLKSLFVVPAYTFDNVKGSFPIGFQIWDTSIKDKFKKAKADIYDENEKYIGKKAFSCYDNSKFINEWLIKTRNRENEKRIGFMACLGNDFQQTNVNFIMNDKNQMASPRGSWVTDKNLVEVSVYYAVRHCMEPTWLNDRDQFLFPNSEWENDEDFQNDCLAFVFFFFFIRSSVGVNHWIPYTEKEVSSRNNFQSRFMSDFLKEKTFSPEALEVLNSGRELWKYYHSVIKNDQDAAVDASFYDIREYFQGRSEKGTMKQKSLDAKYNALIKDLRQKLSALADKIKPKVYKYGFLLE
jgi:hypothetical protein